MAVFLRTPVRSPETVAEFGEGISGRRTMRFDAVLAPESYLVDPTVILLALPIYYLQPYFSADLNFIDPLCVARSARVSRSHEQQGQVSVTYEFTTTPPNPAVGQLPLPPGGEPPSPGQAGGGRADSPSSLAPKYSWDWREVEVAAVKDARTGARIKNTAGFPVNPPPVRRKYNQVLNYMRYEPTYDRDRARQFRAVVNRDTFLGYIPGAVLCHPIKTGERVEIGGQYWFPTHYSFEVHWFGSWLSSFPSLGVQQVGLEPGDAPRPCLDRVTKQKVTEPVPLNADGEQIEDPATEDAALVEYWDYLEEDFAELNIVL